MKKFIFVNDIKQLNFLIDNNYFPQKLTDIVVITNDLGVSYLLNEKSIKFLNLIDLLSAQEIENNWNESYNISNFWKKNDLYTDVIFNFSKQEFVYPFETMLNTITVFNKIFNSYRIEELYIFEMPSIAVLRTGPAPVKHGLNNLSNLVIKFMCTQRSIRVNEIDIKLKLSQNPRLVKNNDENFKYSEKIKTLTNHDSNEIALVFTDGLRLNELNLVSKILSNVLKINVIPIDRYDLENISRFSLNSCPIFNKIDCADFLNFDANLKSKYPEIFDNNFLKFQFLEIFKHIEKTILIGNKFNELVKELSPKYMILGHDAFAFEKVLVHVSKINNIKTISLVHGGIMPKFGIRGTIGDSENYLVWNDFSVRALQGYLKNTHANINAIGSLEYEFNYQSFLKKETSEKNCIYHKSKNTILIVTAEINTALSAIISDPSLHLKIINDIINIAQTRPDLEFIIKPHPSFDHHELYRYIFKQHNIKYIEHLPLGDLLKTTRICLMINYPTTASLEAMLNDKPVIFLDNAIYKFPDMLDNLGNSVVRVDSFEKLIKSIDLLINNTDYCASVLINQRRFMDRFFKHNDYFASENLIRCLNELNENKPYKKNISIYNDGDGIIARDMLIDIYNIIVRSSDFKNLYKELINIKTRHYDFFHLNNSNTLRFFFGAFLSYSLVNNQQYTKITDKLAFSILLIRNINLLSDESFGGNSKIFGQVLLYLFGKGNMTKIRNNVISLRRLFNNSNLF